jgi:hypothetical protein
MALFTFRRPARASLALRTTFITVAFSVEETRRAILFTLSIYSLERFFAYGTKFA